VPSIELLPPPRKTVDLAGRLPKGEVQKAAPIEYLRVARTGVKAD
jgi:hypothetical protein